MIKALLIQLLYFFLLTIYLNYVAFGEALAFLRYLKKAKTKLEKRTFQKQTLPRVP